MVDCQCGALSAAAIHAWRLSSAPLVLRRHGGTQCDLQPVAYFGQAQVEAEIAAVIANITENADFVRGTERTQVINTVFAMLVAGVVCLKHEGFLKSASGGDLRA